MKLTLKGFQSHDETALDIRGRLACVTGPNNVGKSALIRAARWVMYDSLRGSKFMKKGHDLAQVELEVDGRKVVRTKGRKAERNAYEVDGKALESIGTGAPPEVEEALGIRRARIDKDLELELNVVSQKEHPFLMEQTGTAKAKILNALTGLHVLDVAMRQTVTLLRSLRGEEKQLAERKESLAKDLQGFSDLAAKEQAVYYARLRVEEALVRSEKVRAARRDLGALAAALAVAKGLGDRSQPNMPVLEAAWERYEGLSQKVVSGKADLGALRAAQARLSQLSASKAGAADVDGLERAWVRLEGATAMRDAVRGALAARRTLASEASAQGSADARLDCALAELRTLAGSDCPECGQAITQGCLEAIA